MRNPFSQQKWELNGKENKLKRSLTLKSKVSIGIAMVLIAVVITVLIFILQSPVRSYMPSYVSPSKLGRFAEAAVSTDAAPCASIGRDILWRKGSATDAAIAVLLCMGIVNPQSSGLGGGFLMLVYNRTDKKVTYIDAREVSPKKAIESMYGGNATLARVGPLSIAVPGELAGFSFVHEKFGRLPWEELFQPTIRMCLDGIKVTAHMERALKMYENYIALFPEMKDTFSNNETGELLKKDDIYTRPLMAETLNTMAKQKNALYGETQLAKNFLNDLKKAGSIIDKEDMSSYSVRVRNPIRITLRNNMTLYSSALPGGGQLLALILQVMEGFLETNSGFASSKASTVRMLHRLIETFKFTYGKRMELEDDDSKEMQQIVEQLISQEYADEIRSLIDDDRTYDDPEHYGVNVTIKEDHGTAHVSVVSPSGDAVSVTSTVNQYFGSLVMSPSTGILLNDEMDDFSSPSITNYFGVPPTRYNSIRPGKRPLSSMVPSIIIDENDDVRLVVGGNGGTQIISSVAQIIIRNLWLKENIKQTIDAPRFHHQLLPNYISIERLFPHDIIDELKKLGHKTEELGSGMVGIIMAIAKGADGIIYANSDYRKSGEVDGF